MHRPLLVTSPDEGPSPRRRRVVSGSGPPAPSRVLLTGIVLGVIAVVALLVLTRAPATDPDPTADPATASPTTATADPAIVTGTDPGAGGEPLGAEQIAERVRALPTARDVPEATSGPVPVSISFPAIGVDGSPIDPVGVEANGEMEVPSARRVGWYRYGSRPGQPGSTVLAAHIASNGVDGVFRHLADVSLGDRFDLLLDDGTTITYEIVDRAQYEKSQLPFDRIFTRDGPPSVALITCGGVFQPSIRSYEDNVVAYATPRPD